VRHLTATEKLNSYIPQETGYHGFDAIYPSNRHQNWKNLPASFLYN